jgi:hypothetical protein
MAVAAPKQKPRLKTFHATMHVTRTRTEQWCVETEAAKKHASCSLPAPIIGARLATV